MFISPAVSQYNDSLIPVLILHGQLNEATWHPTVSRQPSDWELVLLHHGQDHHDKISHQYRS